LITVAAFDAAGERTREELRALKREQIIGLAPGADMPSPKLQPTADPHGYV
jgi:hypothetical protein